MVHRRSSPPTPPPLPPARLRRLCEPELLDFDTTATLEAVELAAAQQRAAAAVELGAGIPAAGYNLFVLGPTGSYRHRIVRELLQKEAARRPPPPDWCYVDNFDDSRRPLALRLPPGRGGELRRDLARLTEAISAALPAAFENDRYQHRAAELERHLQQGQRRIIEGTSEEVSSWLEERRECVARLGSEVVNVIASSALVELEAKYADVPAAARHLRAVREHAVRSAVKGGGHRRHTPSSATAATATRYEANLLVSHSSDGCAPVVYESHPTLGNLLGRVESITQLGTLTTDFSLIRPGAVHAANGGFLILDAERLLAEPRAWNALKRTLFDGRIRIPCVDGSPRAAAPLSLEPEPIPLDLKVVLIGDRHTHGHLCEVDPDFGELFKVAADFESRLDRSADNTRLYARLIATLARRDGLAPFTRAATARVIEQAARLIGDAEKLTTRLRDIGDLLREAAYWAARESAGVVSSAHVEKAVCGQIQRLDRQRSEAQEEILRNGILIDTHGTKCGQVNGLSVMEVASYSFGQPCRITANVRVGEGEILDIERETELGGAIHSKGVLILASYLASRYATDAPLSMAASLVFEQSYVGVEGDSASLAETCALLSALSRLPLKQSLAVTGSINQHGEVQVIGGVNEKIEGFFDTCHARGLTGEHGVLIPADNVQHLMLRGDLVDAAAGGRFHIYPVRDVDEAISLLTGIPAGERNARGQFPRGTVNHRVEGMLHRLADVRREFDQQTEKKKQQKDHED